MPVSIAIKEVSVYRPQKVVNNDYYRKHFAEQGKDIENLLEALGREDRYVADYENETSLSMAVEAARDVLEKSGLEGRDLDLIVFVSGTPEYFWPPNAVAVHKAISGKEEAAAYDMNAACVGMVAAVEQVSRNMSANPRIKHALIVGSEQMHRYARQDEPVTYASFGDGAAAVILERTAVEAAGFIDAVYKTNTDAIEKIVFPACGVSKMYDIRTPHAEKLIQWENVRNDRAFLSTLELIEKVLDRNGVSTSDVQVFCFSQLSRKNILKIQETMGERAEKFPVVGTEYGYTGAASPFMALEHTLAKGQVKRGDYIVFWSIGAGSVACAMLFKY
ncbi:ketoacyl-ACP synthase III [Peribacillus sp. SCS-26]|uniref:ketoacyl-ACP synthase III n=1 Tax=Paraperibacillus marinus TaxID=3115295 RepID=UPI0039063F9E